jgi:hypothetical protein
MQILAGLHLEGFGCRRVESVGLGGLQIMQYANYCSSFLRHDVFNPFRLLKQICMPHIQGGNWREALRFRAGLS